MRLERERKGGGEGREGREGSRGKENHFENK
jgi:hypothetical protein